MRKFTTAFGLGLLLVAGSATPAFAQVTSPTSGQPYATCANPPKIDEEGARLKYTAGRVDYDEGHTQSAIDRFREAYSRDCTKHELLIIISRAYEQLNDRAEAIRALEEYLKRVPNSQDRATYEKRIASYKDYLEKDKAQKAAAAPPNGGAGGTPAGAGTGTAAGGTTTPPPNTDKGGGHTIPPWIVVGVGATAIVVGGIVLAIAPKLPTNCNDSTLKCEKTPGESDADFNKDQDNAGKHVGMTTGGLVAIIGGAGLVAGGLIWHFVEPTGSSSASRSPKITPAIAPGYAGLSLGASF